MKNVQNFDCSKDLDRVTFTGIIISKAACNINLPVQAIAFSRFIANIEISAHRVIGQALYYLMYKLCIT